MTSESDTTFRAVLEAAPDAMLVAEGDGTIRFVNRAAERLFGHGRDELVGRSVDLVVPDALGDGARDLTARHRDGHGIPVEISRSTLESPGGTLVIAAVRDVSERRRAEALGARARREAVVAEIGRLALTTQDLDRVLRAGVDRAAELLGVDYAAVLERDPAGTALVLHTESAPSSVERGTIFPLGDTVFGAAIRRFESLVAEDLRSDDRFAGLPRLHETGARAGMFVPMYVGSRLLGGVAVLARDRRRFSGDDLHFLQALTNVLAAAIDRAVVAEQLTASRMRLQAFVDNTPAAIFMKGLDGRYLLVNRFLATLLGSSPEDIIGRCDHDFFPAGEADVLRRTDERVLAGEGPVEVEEHVHVDGRVRVFSSLKFPLRDATGRTYALAGVSTDVTDRQQARHEREALAARLRQVERLETVGQLAGGIAHDFNNLLAVITNFAGFVKAEVEPGSTVASDVEQITEAARRASELTRRLLVFSRRQAVENELVDLGAVLHDLQNMLSRTLGSHITLAVDVEPGLPPVEADRSQLDQVVMNLAVNARDAMPEGGTLTLAVSRATLDASWNPPSALGYVCLEVSDTGVGMDAETVERAFEPFFTTKGSGMGTGLGLATVYGIATQAGGHVDIESAPGRGTTVRILLPAIAGEPEEGTPAPIAPRRSGAGERLLVVEDESAVRQSTVRILRDAGYVVIEAASGDDALALAGTGATIDLLLTDVVMPGMSGTELAERLRARSDVPIVFMSGYAEDRLGAEADIPDASFIAKPFAAERLLEAVEQALATRFA